MRRFPCQTSRIVKRVLSTNRIENSKYLPDEVLNILCCPLSKDELIYRKDLDALISRATKIAFPFSNGILNLRPHAGFIVEDV